MKHFILASFASLLTTNAIAADFECKGKDSSSAAQVELRNLNENSISFDVSDGDETYIRIHGKYEEVSQHAFYGFSRGSSYHIAHIPFEMLRNNPAAKSYDVALHSTILKEDGEIMSILTKAVCVPK